MLLFLPKHSSYYPSRSPVILLERESLTKLNKSGSSRFCLWSEVSALPAFRDLQKKHVCLYKFVSVSWSRWFDLFFHFHLVIYSVYRKWNDNPPQVPPKPCSVSLLGDVTQTELIKEREDPINLARPEEHHHEQQICPCGPSSWETDVQNMSADNRLTAQAVRQKSGFWQTLQNTQDMDRMWMTGWDSVGNQVHSSLGGIARN